MIVGITRTPNYLSATSPRRAYNISHFCSCDPSNFLSTSTRLLLHTSEQMSFFKSSNASKASFSSTSPSAPLRHSSEQNSSTLSSGGPHSPKGRRMQSSDHRSSRDAAFIPLSKQRRLSPIVVACSETVAFGLATSHEVAARFQPSGQLCLVSTAVAERTPCSVIGNVQAWECGRLVVRREPSEVARIRCTEMIYSTARRVHVFTSHD